jgi:hypothetical protein
MQAEGTPSTIVLNDLVTSAAPSVIVPVTRMIEKCIFDIRRGGVDSDRALTVDLPRLLQFLQALDMQAAQSPFSRPLLTFAGSAVDCDRTIRVGLVDAMRRLQETANARIGGTMMVLETVTNSPKDAQKEQVKTDEVKSEAKSEGKSEVKSEVKLEAKLEAKSEVKSEAKVDVKRKIEAEVNLELEVQQEVEVERKVQDKGGTDSEVVSEVKSKLKADVNALMTKEFNKDAIAENSKMFMELFADKSTGVPWSAAGAATAAAAAAGAAAGGLVAPVAPATPAVFPAYNIAIPASLVKKQTEAAAADAAAAAMALQGIDEESTLVTKNAQDIKADSKGIVEETKNVQTDSRRFYQLSKSLADAKQPFSKFGTGNRETLKTTSEAKEDVKQHIKTDSTAAVDKNSDSAASVDPMIRVLVHILKEELGKSLRCSFVPEKPSLVHAISYNDITDEHEDNDEESGTDGEGINCWLMTVDPSTLHVTRRRLVDLPLSLQGVASKSQWDAALKICSQDWELFFSEPKSAVDSHEQWLSTTVQLVSTDQQVNFGILKEVVSIPNVTILAALRERSVALSLGCLKELQYSFFSYAIEVARDIGEMESIGWFQHTLLTKLADYDSEEEKSEWALNDFHLACAYALTLAQYADVLAALFSGVASKIKGFEPHMSIASPSIELQGSLRLCVTSEIPQAVRAGKVPL